MICLIKYDVYEKGGWESKPLSAAEEGEATCKAPMAPDLSLWKRTLHSAVLCFLVCWNGNVSHVLLWTPASNAQPKELTNAYGQSYDANNVRKTYPKRQATSADSKHNNTIHHVTARLKHDMWCTGVLI